MAFLDELSRKLRAQLPNWMGGQPNEMQGMIPGQAQLRAPGHPNAFVLPQDQYNSAAGAFGVPGAAGLTVSSPGIVDWLASRSNAPNRAIYSSAKQSPTVVLPQDFNRSTAQHEAFHAGPYQSVMNKINPQEVMKLIPQEAQASMLRFYKPSEMAGEIGARAMNEPESMQLDATGSGVNTGSDLRRRLIDMMRKIDPSRATALSKQWGLTGSEKGDGVAELQRPNDTF